ncbi:MAG: phosphoenolpyruvate kinase, partial [Gemmatimonadota bacterium]|nr:phosphoenolpyruvate kinase [Gemmatimonadota bacterium]
VHTVYGGAQLFRADSVPKLGALALRALEAYAPDAATLGGALGLPAEGAERVHGRVLEKLRREPVEDFRIDFEDGYGNRPDAEEDGHAESVAREVARGMEEGTLPPFLGIRIKPLNEELRERSVRTLDLFLTTLVQATGGALPPGFVLTLPKVTLPDQVEFFGDVLDTLEDRLALGRGALRFEVMVETPQSIFGPGGEAALPRILEAGEGRITGAHFGTYDYTASLGITAAQQRTRHPACDFARHVMQVALAGTGVWLSDGSTTVMPVPVHRGERLTPEQQRENRESVHRAWRMHFDDVRHSLAHAFYQGWDLHPAQLPTRYAAVFSFFLEGVEAQGRRLRNFVEKAAQATLVGDVFDDAATGQGLLNYFARGINCGALTEEEAREMTGLALDELRGRSFLRILQNRRGG